MNVLWRRLELPVVLILFLAGAGFLLKMCYLSLTFNTFFGLIFLTAVYSYVRLRHGLKLPVFLLLLVFAALQVDALGNFFRLYGTQLGPIQYDEFSHLTVQILVTPVIIWLFKKTLDTRGYTMPPGLTCFFGATVIFSLSAFYEIIELWDDIYFNGQRIWGTYDTARDLQWDLLGILIGAGLSNVFLRARAGLPQPVQTGS